MRDDEPDVLAANQQFYDAFVAADPRAMDAVWARTTAVTCLHPGWLPLIGREAVMESWRDIFGSRQAPRVRASRPRVFVNGDCAYVLCYESADDSPPALAATNIFVREEAGWRMLHHHAGQLVAPVEDDEGPNEDPSPRARGTVN